TLLEVDATRRPREESLVGWTAEARLEERPQPLAIDLLEAAALDDHRSAPEQRAGALDGEQLAQKVERRGDGHQELVRHQIEHQPTRLGDERTLLARQLA